jgi:LysR family hydrogen peroxide-inducible transcriptional activator
MEIRQLQYVLTVAKTRHFTKAATKLHIAQPSLSQQISKLEEEIGTQLFDRGTNPLQLTYAGQLFVEKAQTIIDSLEQLRTEMEDVAQLKKGKLIVGSLPMTGSHVMPVILPLFRKRYPDIEVVLIEDTTANLESLTAKGDVDLCLLSLPINLEQLEYRPLLDESIVIAVPHDSPHAHAQHKQFALRDFREEPFIALKQGQGFREITLKLCQEAGFSPQIVFESNNIETIQSLVAAGMGVALVPQMVMREQHSRHAPTYFSLKDAGAQRSLVIGYRKQRYLSKAAQTFIETVTEIMQQQPTF